LKLHVAIQKLIGIIILIKTRKVVFCGFFEVFLKSFLKYKKIN
jgi:hypothetical protein